MKPFVIIASICVIISFLFVATCVYQYGKALNEIDAALNNESSTEVSLSNTNQVYNIMTDSLEIISNLPCDSILVVVPDKITKDTVFGAYPTLNFKSSHFDPISLTLARKGNILMFIFKIDGFVCLNEPDIYLIFNDGTNKKFSTNSEMNCEGEATIRFIENNKDLLRIKQSRITGVSIRDEDGKYEGDLNKFDEARLQKQLNCII